MTTEVKPPSGKLPILYSFRRCPYAMRARLALLASGIQCELREVVLRNKPAEFLATSPKGTVPVLVTTKGEVIEQSLGHHAVGFASTRPGTMVAVRRQSV